MSVIVFIVRCSRCARVNYKLHCVQFFKRISSDLVWSFWRTMMTVVVNNTLGKNYKKSLISNSMIFDIMMSKDLKITWLQKNFSFFLNLISHLPWECSTVVYVCLLKVKVFRFFKNLFCSFFWRKLNPFQETYNKKDIHTYHTWPDET